MGYQKLLVMLLIISLQYCCCLNNTVAVKQYTRVLLQ